MSKVTPKDIEKLRDFIALNKNDTDSPIVWMAEILEKLATENYYK